jgi:hypothetical protein
MIEAISHLYKNAGRGLTNMGMLFGGGGSSRPPPPPPPPANPPTYASASFVPPFMGGSGTYAGLSQSILTSPFGAPDSRSTQRKTLLGQ